MTDPKESTDWWELAFTIACLAPMPIVVLYMAFRVVFG